MNNNHFPYGHPTVANRPVGMVVIWVLGDHGRHEFVIGVDAVPPRGRAGDVIARLGPFAYEEGQGLEPYREQLAEIVVADTTERHRREEAQRLADMVKREVARQAPPPAAPEASAHHPAEGLKL